MTLDEVRKLRERLEALNKAAALPPAPPPAIHRSAPSTAPAADEDDSPAELRAIMQVESSGGKNLKHPTVEHGLNAGTHAGGGYAVMPLTFRDVVRRNASLKTKYGHIADQEPDKISDYLNANKESSKEVATHYYKELSDRFKGDHVKVAHAWNHGPGNTAKLKDDEIQSSDYVKKYLTAYKTEKAKDEAKAKRKNVQEMMSEAAASFKPTPMITAGGKGSFSGGIAKAEESAPQQPKWEHLGVHHAAMDIGDSLVADPKGFHAKMSAPSNHPNSLRDSQSHTPVPDHHVVLFRSNGTDILNPASRSGAYHAFMHAGSSGQHASYHSDQHPPLIQNRYGGAYNAGFKEPHEALAALGHQIHADNNRNANYVYGIKPHEAEAVQTAFGHGTGRFLGEHPDAVKHHVNRAMEHMRSQSDDPKWLGKVEIPAKELVEEHKHLVDVLESPSHADDKVEAKKQKAELKGYEKQLDKSDDEDDYAKHRRLKAAAYSAFNDYDSAWHNLHDLKQGEDHLPHSGWSTPTPQQKKAAGDAFNAYSLAEREAAAHESAMTGEDYHEVVGKLTDEIRNASNAKCPGCRYMLPPKGDDVSKALDTGLFDAEDEELFKSKERHQQLYTEDMSPHKGKKVFVYFNLHHKVWSVRHNGKVIAHTKQLHLGDAKFKVSEAGRQRVLKEKQKNIHAGVEGTITEPRKMPDHKVRVSYNPYTAGHFYRADDPNKPAIHDANHVHMEVNEGTDPNGHQVRFPRVHAIQNTPARLKKSRIDAIAKGEPKVAQKLQWENVALGRAARTNTHVYHHVYAGGNHGLNIASHEELKDRTRSHLREYPHMGSQDNAERVAQRHHIRETYGLNRRDEHVADLAWPGTDDRGRGIERFVGAHPDSVKADMARAHASVPAPEDISKGRGKNADNYFGQSKSIRWRLRGAPYHNERGAVDSRRGVPRGHGRYIIDRSYDNHVLTYIPHMPSGAFGTPKRLGEYKNYTETKQAALEHHVATHYKLSPEDVAAVKQAWPEQGVARFHQKHPDHVKAEVARARGAIEKRERFEALTDLVEKAIDDIDSGDHVGRKADDIGRNWDHYDYNHLLSPEHRASGYSLHVQARAEGESPRSRLRLMSVLHHNGKEVGAVEGFVHDTSVEPHSGLQSEHRGKKLGVAMYEALYAHSKKRMGITHVRGGHHSRAASRVHQALARKHGLGYTGNEDDRSRYSYAIKSEEFSKAISDIKPGNLVAKKPWRHTYDYSHLLSKENHRAGYQLFVHEKVAGGKLHDPKAGEPDLIAAVHHKGKEVGSVISDIHGELRDPYSKPVRFLTPHSGFMDAAAHKGKGLGRAAYEALYAHGLHKHGIKRVKGGEHTEDAARVHESLSRRHGIRYKPSDYGSDDGDNERGPYRYMIKSEEEPDVHPDLREAFDIWHSGGVDYHKVFTANSTQKGWTHLHEDHGKLLDDHAKKTQEHLRKLHGDHITLYRGIKGAAADQIRQRMKSGKPIRIRLSHRSDQHHHSMTSSPEVALRFARRSSLMDYGQRGSPDKPIRAPGLVIGVKVPVSKIVHSYHSINSDPNLDFWAQQQEHVVHHEGHVKVHPSEIHDLERPDSNFDSWKDKHVPGTLVKDDSPIVLDDDDEWHSHLNSEKD